jgi:hypothetical protein
MSGSNPFQENGSWYKAALHVHTTRSDGRLSPKEVIEAYRQRGYDVLAVTDHDVITDLSPLSDNGFLNIPSVEVCYGKNEVGQSYHLVVLGVRDMVDLPRETPVQDAISEWRDAQRRAQAEPVIILAHPYWSGMTSAEMMALDELAGLEIHNTSARTDLGKGLSTVHWDQVLARGKRWWGYAVDDVHWMRRHGQYGEAFGGWVWVKTDALEEGPVLEALRQGQFYASSGPRIDAFSVENGVAGVQCSEVVTINFVGRTQWGSQHEAAPGCAITGAEHHLSGNERYLRVECIDAQGHGAWTNPIFLD